MAPSDGYKSLLLRRIAIILLLIHGCWSAQVAKSQYIMDRREDCVFVGILDVERDKTTFVVARSPSPEASPQLSCTLQFSPQTKGDTLKVWFESGAYIADCDVSLDVQMTDNQIFQKTCQPGGELPKLEARDGRLRIQLKRRSYSSTNYAFKIGVKAERSVAGGSGGSGSGSDLGIGVIIGIVVGVIVFFVIFCVVGVWCYLKYKGSDKVQGNAVPPAQNYESKARQNGAATNSVEESPASDHRLLVRNENNDSLQNKTALERFGPVARHRPRNPADDYVDVEAGQSQKSREQRGRQEEENVRRSPLLSDLHHNPRFRRSFHENEVDARGRANRISYSSENSSESFNSRGVPLPPKLPPVPKSPPRSPSPHRRGEKIAMVSRDRPLSSSSDLARQLDENATPDEASDDDRRRTKKADTKHTLRPSRGEKKSRRDEEDDSEEEMRRRKDRERRERERQDEEEEEERRRKRREERRKREEEEKKRRRKQRDEDQDDDRREREGRFKKSASGRKSKGKTPRKGRSKSTGNALDEMEDNYQRSRSKSPSSVRSLNFIEDDDDDDDLDSSYMPFKRSGSKTSLYASRSSLYGRRRKNSMGETMSLSSYAYDDADSRYGDFDKKGLSRREKDRMFKSTGELEMHTATAQVVRECATQTGAEKAVSVYGRKTIAKSRPGRMYSRGSQTGVGRERRDSTGSARSGKSGRSSKSNSRLKHKSKSQESLRKMRRSRSRNLDDSDDSDDRRSRKSRSKSRNLDYSDDDVESRSGRRKHQRSKSRGLDDEGEDDRQSSRGGRGKSRPRPRKSAGASVDLSDSDVSEGGRSAAASSIAASMAHPPPSNPFGHFVPVAYPPGAMTYLPTAPGGPPMMPYMAGAKPPVAPKPAVAPKPQKSKWETLVEMTDGEKQRQSHDMDYPTETESMISSVYGRHPSNGAQGGNVYAPPSYTTAQRYPNPNASLSSNYPDSSGLPNSARGQHEYKLDSYPPSESMI